MATCRLIQGNPMMRRHLLPACLCLLAALPAAATPASPATSFQIVQSVPKATVIGEPDVPRTQQVWLQMIGAARHRIDIAAFYIADKPGEALAPVMDALVARANAGVKLRILLDHTFQKQSQAAIERLREVPNVELRILPVDKLTGGVLHAKYMAVDDADVFVGSQNLDWRAIDQIHEIGARIVDTRFAATFRAAFDFTWKLAADPDLPKAAIAAAKPPAFAPVTAEDPAILDAGGDDPLVAFPAFSPPAMMPRWLSDEQSALLRMIDASRKLLRIQVMTLSGYRDFGPSGYWPPIDSALRNAAARGVQVRIIVADWSLHEPAQAYLKSLAVLPGIEVKFSRLPQAPEGFIPYARVEHCKYAVADDRSIYIGTGNWGWSYFESSVDASVFVHGRGPARTLSHIFDRDWDGPYVTTIEPGVDYEPAKTH